MSYIPQINKIEEHDQVSSIILDAPRRDDPKVPTGVMATVYEALISAFRQEQELGEINASIVRKEIADQLEANDRLRALSFKALPTIDDIINQKRTDFINSFPPEARQDVISLMDHPKNRHLYLKVHHRWGYKIANKAKEFAHRDLSKEAHDELNERYLYQNNDNMVVTAKRQSINNELNLCGQSEQLAVANCQTTVNSANQTVSTFTSCLTTHKEAISSVSR